MHCVPAFGDVRVRRKGRLTMTRSGGGQYRVACARCGSYDSAEVSQAMKSVMGVLHPPISEDVLLKVNLLAPRDPEKAVTTHPRVVSACIDCIRTGRSEAGIHIADTPGYIFLDQKEELFRKTGFKALAETETAGLSLLSDRGYKEVELPEGVALSVVRAASRAVEAPCLMSVARLKTHVETEITGCLKNMFGMADTDTRKKAHSGVSLDRLSHAVVDIFSARIPDYCVLDAVVSMEGDGPSHGSPVHTGWLLASDNALAVDVAGAVIMGYSDPFSIPLLRVAAQRGMGPSSMDEIELTGADWKDLVCPGFRKSSSRLRLVPTGLRGLAHRMVYLYPRLNPETCTGCGICEKVCPANAIHLESGRPVIDVNACVRCLCCHEMCPAGAMEVKRSLLCRLLG